MLEIRVRHEFAEFPEVKARNHVLEDVDFRAFIPAIEVEDHPAPLARRGSGFPPFPIVKPAAVSDIAFEHGPVHEVVDVDA